jgi:hypothetical protein
MILLFLLLHVLWSPQGPLFLRFQLRLGYFRSLRKLHRKKSSRHHHRVQLFHNGRVLQRFLQSLELVPLFPLNRNQFLLLKLPHHHLKLQYPWSRYLLQPG